MKLEQLQQWAQSQIDNSAFSEGRPDIGVSVLQLVDELERLQDHAKELEAKLSIASTSKS
ncbi:hypothetical protein [Leptolyngbya sp. NIES-2104]|uniref:hypothetical protein n=1 Tax=Leptolyngbya sp. NIES-2104 TaxID=1552121 RepID=UPI0006EC86F6|nr:hypothetical protein [Leptolyngbya sp. NIES-2104]GAP93653.1 hypothetical protein NIES2104_01600 [Leptolyngbya sp. NIES-2104]